MNIANTFFQYGTECVFVAGVSGVGWILTIYCLFDKYDKEKDKPVHLVNDIVNATFAVVTLVAAVTIAINFTFHLPEPLFGKVDNILSHVESIKNKPDPEYPDVGQEIELINDTLRRLEDLINTIKNKPDPEYPDVGQEIEPIKDTIEQIKERLITPPPTSFAEEILKLHQTGTLGGDRAVANAQFSNLVKHFFRERFPHFLEGLELGDNVFYFKINGIDDFSFKIRYHNLTGEVIPIEQ